MRMVEHRARRKSREAARTNMTATPLLLSDNPVECMLDDLIGGSRRSVFSKWLMGYEPPACARRDATMTRQRPSPPASPYRNYQDHGGFYCVPGERLRRFQAGQCRRRESTGGSRIQTEGPTCAARASRRREPLSRSAHFTSLRLVAHGEPRRFFNAHWDHEPLGKTPPIADRVATILPQERGQG